jgi:hypothetical protein
MARLALHFFGKINKMLLCYHSFYDQLCLPIKKAPQKGGSKILMKGINQLNA